MGGSNTLSELKGIHNGVKNSWRGDQEWGNIWNVNKEHTFLKKTQNKWITTSIYRFPLDLRKIITTHISRAIQ